MRSADIEVPNRSVDMNSWLPSACYPRRTFYPLSDGPSIQNHRITKACCRTCSTCWCRSQPRLCLCTRRLISKQPERSFARLRYRLGGDRPSQTTRLTMSLSRFRARPPQSTYPPHYVPLPVYGSRLEPQNSQGGISPLAPPSPKAWVQSL